MVVMGTPEFDSLGHKIAFFDHGALIKSWGCLSERKSLVVTRRHVFLIDDHFVV